MRRSLRRLHGRKESKTKQIHILFVGNIHVDSDLFWFYVATDCSTGQDMANFEEFTADGKISPFSRSNHKAATELITVDWNV